MQVRSTWLTAVTVSLTFSSSALAALPSPLVVQEASGGGGLQYLGSLGGNSNASEVSADGSVVVGYSNLPDGQGRAFRWTAATGMQDLGTLGGQSVAESMSAAGTKVVGNSYLPNGQMRAFRWTGAEPNTGNAYCFGDGSGAACPCGAAGNPGEGCMNTSGTGAKLVGTGAADLGEETFTLMVGGAPPNKPGIFFQGTTQIANPLGDGIWCSNASMRYGVNMTDGQGNAVQAGLGENASVAEVLNYQYWFRDPGNSCGGGFNFSNAWTVTWE